MFSDNYILLLKTHFEKVSLIYHIFFILFLTWVIFIKDKKQKINKNFIRGLGLYVIFYGFNIFWFGPRLMNGEL